MRILIATVQVPFVHGGAELHAQALCDALVARGHEAELLAFPIPFQWNPPERILDQMLTCRLLDVTETSGMAVDRVIAMKFPAYLVPHPNKVVWLLHQHRTAYDLWGSPYDVLCGHANGLAVRNAIWEADRKILPEARALFANSANVARRLKHYCGLDSTPLYHPPPQRGTVLLRPGRGLLFLS